MSGKRLARDAASMVLDRLAAAGSVPPVIIGAIWGGGAEDVIKEQQRLNQMYARHKMHNI
jgi:hypothetical protein